MNLLLSWDDQKTISAAEMEEFLSRFLEVQILTCQSPVVSPKTDNLLLSGVTQGLMRMLITDDFPKQWMMTTRTFDHAMCPLSSIGEVHIAGLEEHF